MDYSQPMHEVVRLRIHLLVRDRGISISRLARLADLSYTTVYKLVQQPDADTTLRTLVKIARALRVRVCDLIEEHDESLVTDGI